MRNSGLCRAKVPSSAIAAKAPAGFNRNEGSEFRFDFPAGIYAGPAIGEPADKEEDKKKKLGG